MNSMLIKFTFALFMAINSLSISALTEEEKGYILAEKIESRDAGFGSSFSKLDMILQDANQKTTSRKLEIQILEDSKEGNKSIIRFLFPGDIKGTSLLTHPKPGFSDDQWLYLPFNNRTKRISSRNKSGAFVGSEFSFEDLSDKSLEDYKYLYVSEGPCSEDASLPSDWQCDIIERYPIDKSSGYSKQKVWVDKSALRITKIEYFDRSKTLFKRFIAREFKFFDNKYWRPMKVTMTNLRNNKRTSLIYDTIEFNYGFTKNDFRRSSLGR